MSTTETQTTTVVAEQQKPVVALSHKEPLQLKGVLDKYKSFDVTPIIGREFIDADLKDWLDAPNSDDLIRDLAITSKTTVLAIA